MNSCFVVLFESELGALLLEILSAQFKNESDVLKVHVFH